MAKSKPIQSLSFEEALQELEVIVRNLESGDSSLDDALADFTRGNALKEHCAKKLADAKLKVEKITLTQAGDAKSSEAFTQPPE
jgi:exodeoxyribonuclease VII small subunit